MIMLLDFALINPKTPSKISLPAGGLCGTDMNIVVAGSLPLDMDEVLELSIIDRNGNEPVHVSVNGKDKRISNLRKINGTLMYLDDATWEATDIENGEPFKITYVIICVIQTWFSFF